MIGEKWSAGNDIHQVFTDGGRRRPQEFQADKSHLSAAGYKEWAELLKL